MRVLFTGDWQLGAGQNLGTAEYGHGSRFQDQIDVLERIGDLAIEQDVKLVGMLGDAFERERPAPHEILAVQGFVHRMNQAGIRCLFLMGNHDSRGAALPSALEIFADTGCAVALAPTLLEFPPNAPEVVVACLPWVPPGAIVAEMGDVPRDEVNDRAALALAGGARMLAERCKVEYPDAIRILVGHWSISGASLPTGLDTAMLREPVIPLESLTESGFHLAAFSHIHRAQVLASGPTPVFYTGAPMVNTWGEVEGDHGVWIYDTEGPSLKMHSIADNKRFLTYDPQWTFGEVATWLEPDVDVVGAVVRVAYTLTEEEARKADQSVIRKRLLELGAAKVIFKPTIVKDQRARAEGIADDSLDEVGALELWLSSQMIEAPLAAAMRSEHARYLAEAKA